MLTIWRTLSTCKDGIILVATPLFLSPLLITNYQSAEHRSAFVILLMVIYWMLQPIPLAVTALLPVALFPLLELATTDKACEPYLQSTNMLFMASLIIAIAMESSGFHKRIALRILILLGHNLKTLFAGFMFTTMFLGIWIINTAATAMILPIADVVIEQLFDDGQLDCELTNGQLMGRESADFNLAEIETLAVCKTKVMRKKLNYIKRLLYICIAFSATMGGTTTLTSNGPNLVFQFVLDELYQGLPKIDYTNWMLFCLPATIASVLICWLVMSTIYLKKDLLKHIKGSPRMALEKKYTELGPITFHELSVCSLFALLILLWMFRNPQFLTGWAKVFSSKIMPKDATPAILIVILMFCIPSNPLGPFPSKSLLEWNSVQAKLAWGVILLRGGGFAMADVAASSGLTKTIAESLNQIYNLPTYLVIVLITLLASFTTELASNSAIATIFLPISGEIASQLSKNPLMFLIPVTLSCSFAFILPVGTPANALVTAHANLRASDMLLPGFLTKLICICVMLINLFVTGFPMFSLATIPDWANSTATV